MEMRLLLCLGTVLVFLLGCNVTTPCIDEGCIPPDTDIDQVERNKLPIWPIPPVDYKDEPLCCLPPKIGLVPKEEK
jgi:hypothetical protein